MRLVTQDEWHVDQGKLQKQIEQYKNERKAMGKKGKRKCYLSFLNISLSFQICVEHFISTE